MYAPQLLGGVNHLALFDFSYRYETAGPSIKRLPVKHWGGGEGGGGGSHREPAKHTLLTSFSYGSHTYQSLHLFPWKQTWFGQVNWSVMSWRRFGEPNLLFDSQPRRGYKFGYLLLEMTGLLQLTPGPDAP